MIKKIQLFKNPRGSRLIKTNNSFLQIELEKILIIQFIKLTYINSIKNTCENQMLM
jgi:hypothetical protein